MSRSITSNARRAVAGSTCASLGSLVTSSRVGAHRRLLGGLLRRAALDEEPPPHAGRDRARLHAVPALQLDLGTISPIGKACWRCRVSCATVLGRHDGDAIRETSRPTVVDPTFMLSSVFFHAGPCNDWAGHESRKPINRPPRRVLLRSGRSVSRHY